jgi:hypothetical protein
MEQWKYVLEYALRRQHASYRSKAYKEGITQEKSTDKPHKYPQGCPKSPRGKVHLLQLHNQAIYLTFATTADKASDLIGSHMRNSHKGTIYFSTWESKMNSEVH